MTWVEVAPGADGDTDALLRLLPDTYDRLRALSAQVWDGDVDPVLLDLCRLRMAQLIGSRADLAVRHDRAVAGGLTEELVVELTRWPTSPAFSEGQRAVIGFAEQWAIDAQGVTDDQAAEVRRHLSDRQIAQLTTALALFDALARVRAVLAVEPVGPAPTVTGTAVTDPLT